MCVILSAVDMVGLRFEVFYLKFQTCNILSVQQRGYHTFKPAISSPSSGEDITHFNFSKKRWYPLHPAERIVVLLQKGKEPLSSSLDGEDNVFY